MTAAANPRDRIDFFAIFLALTIVRMPRIVFDGRFWAEEGRVFYAKAATAPWYEALLLSHTGYLNLGANLAAVAAWHLAPIEDAPHVMLAFALAGQLCPAILLTTTRAPWLESRIALAAALLLLLGAPSNEEGWLSTLHNQFQLALCAGLILTLDIEPGVREVFRRILLFLAPLHGLVAIFVLPLFVARSIVDRSMGRLIQALIMTAAATIQLVFFYHASPERQSHDPKLIIGTFYAKDIVLPFLGYDGSASILSRLRLALDSGYLPDSAMITLAAAAFAMILLLRRAPAVCWWLIAACGAIALGSYYFALLASPPQVEPHIGGRYAFVPQVLFAWTMLAIGCSGNRLSNRVASVLAGWLMVVGVVAYLSPEAEFRAGPDWRQEVAKWKRDPTYSPAVWPGGGWTVPLPARDH